MTGLAIKEVVSTSLGIWRPGAQDTNTTSLHYPQKPWSGLSLDLGKPGVIK